MEIHVGFKENVKLYGLQPEGLRIIDEAAALYAAYGYNLVVTSARDSVHGNYSHHYKGLAVDLRTRNVTVEHQAKLRDNIQSILGSEYQVILESDHMHIEYDPRTL